MNRSIGMGVLTLLVLTGVGFALTPTLPPASLTDLPPEVAYAQTVQFWVTGDGQVIHTPTLKDVQEAIEAGILAPGTVLGNGGGEPQPLPVDEFMWPMHGHDVYQNAWNPLIPQDTLRSLWTATYTSAAWAPWFGYPAIAAGKVVYVDCGTGYLYCRDITDGTVIWSTQVQASSYYPGSPVIFEGTGGQLWVAVPNYGTSGNTPRVSCYRLDNGQSVWTAAVPLGSAGASSTNLNFNRPVYYNGYIYHITLEFSTPYGGVLYRVNALTGDTMRLSTRGSSCGGALTIDPNGQYGYWPCWNPASPSNPKIMKINLATGALVDSTPVITDYPRGSVAINPTTRRLFCGGSASTSGSGSIRCYNADNLAAGPIWTFTTSGGHDIQYPAIDYENVYYTTQSTPGRLYAVKQSDGTGAWNTQGYITVPDNSAIYDGVPCVTGAVGSTRYVYLTPGYYTGANIWVVNAANGNTVQYRQVSSSEYMFTGASRPAGYFVSKSGYGTIFCFRSPNDLTIRNHDIAAYRIDIPEGVKLTPGQTITPTVTYINYGTNNEANFLVAFRVDSADQNLYLEGVLITDSVLSGDTFSVTFPDWTPANQYWAGYQIKAWVELTGDEAPGNDTVRRACMTTTDTCYSYRSNNAPSIDGYLAAGEWDDAYYVNVSNIAGWGGMTQSSNAAWMRLKHDGNNLYLAFGMPQAMTRDAGDQIGFYLDESGDGEWATDNSEGNYWFWVNQYNNDEVLYRWHTPDTFGQQLTVPGAQSASGTLNGYLVFEVKVPFGTLPYQISMNPVNDTGKLWLFSLDGSSFYGWWPADMPDTLWRQPMYYGTFILRTLQTGDVGVKSIDAPRSARPGDAVVPKATWKNFGTTSMNFTAYYLMNDPSGTRVYSESQTATLAGGAEIQLTFPSYVVNTEGDWAVKCSTVAGGDVNAANDIRTGTFRVSTAPPVTPGWVEVKSIPGAPKDGAFLAFNPDNGLIYAARGYKSGDFYAYDPNADSAGNWTTLTPIPATEGKLPYKGANGCYGDGYIYATIGNNTQGFLRYSIEGNSWEPLAAVPLGASGKKVKGGTDLVYVDGYVYLLKGYKTDFFRYNVAASAWESLPSAPAGTRPKWDKGSWLVWDGQNTLYAHKAKYGEMWTFDLTTQQWGTASLPGMPTSSSKTGKNKKSKDGSDGAYYNGYIYALKGGNTVEWWRYEVAGNAWTELDPMPEVGSTGKKKRVKAGGALAGYGDNPIFFALKGGKIQEFWRYYDTTVVVYAAKPERSGVMAEQVNANRFGFSVAPNPVVKGYGLLSYSVPQQAPARLTVYDVTGRDVMHLTFVASGTGTRNLDLRSLAAGVYLVKFESAGYNASQKLIVR
ncbi:T9SS type A sorting domain-containing protein [candidate division WOR-3 bacterium]|nr:T9SS type A sorting domain-containing protein [candidate division WOR-3 bacterium]